MHSPSLLLKRCILIVFSLLLLVPSSSGARYYPKERNSKDSTRPLRTMVIDGSTVHNIGQLQMHITNWGEFGSRPSWALPWSEAPSAQWPAGSGVEYLWAAGLWVGAVRSGVPMVSTATYSWEFHPSQDPIDIMYRTAEGARGGNRLPSPTADDDNDGLIDEDWLNGRDDDEDGLIDEDFAAISKQMFSCSYTDDQPVTLQLHPQHNPLHIKVRQESYQWEEDRFDDFIGIEYKITNMGSDAIEDIYIGFFADCDAGARDADNYWKMTQQAGISDRWLARISARFRLILLLHMMRMGTKGKPQATSA